MRTDEIRTALLRGFNKEGEGRNCKSSVRAQCQPSPETLRVTDFPGCRKELRACSCSRSVVPLTHHFSGLLRWAQKVFPLLVMSDALSSSCSSLSLFITTFISLTSVVFFLFFFLTWLHSAIHLLSFNFTAYNRPKKNSSNKILTVLAHVNTINALNCSNGIYLWKKIYQKTDSLIKNPLKVVFSIPSLGHILRCLKYVNPDPFT